MEGDTDSFPRRCVASIIRSVHPLIALWSCRSDTDPPHSVYYRSHRSESGLQSWWAKNAVTSVLQHSTRPCSLRWLRDFDNCHVCRHETYGATVATPLRERSPWLWREDVYERTSNLVSTCKWGLYVRWLRQVLFWCKFWNVVKFNADKFRSESVKFGLLCIYVLD